MVMLRRFVCSLPLVLLGTSVALAEPSAATDDSAGFVRIRKDSEGEPLALETAVARFASKQDNSSQVMVDLVGAIHVGDKQYYDQLNRRFRDYDAVLYELVASEDANVPQPGQRPGSMIGGMQVGMKSMLELEFQLDCIDYTAANMVHADMSPEQFAQTMKQRNESFMQTFFRLMGRSFAEQSKDPLGTGDIKILAALFAKDRAHQLKLAMAEQFADLESEMAVFDGPDGSTIITERNKKAFEVLARELKHGKKKLAIFYGAGHLADMQRRLEEDFGLTRVQTDWLPAWSLTSQGMTSQHDPDQPESTTQ